MKPARIAILTLLGGAALLSASGVQAGITSHGNSCVPAHPVLDANSFLYGSNGIGRVTFERAWVVARCPRRSRSGPSPTSIFKLNLRTRKSVFNASEPCSTRTVI